MSQGAFQDRLRRGIVTAIIALFYWKLPQVMPFSWKLGMIVLIFIFFFVLPDLKGMGGGIVAGFFSLAFAGLGHIYVREYTRAFLFLLGGVFAYMTSGYSSKSVVFNILLFILAAFDAYSFGKRGYGIL